MRRKFGIQLGLVGLALFGLLIVQYYWIHRALELRNDELTAQVNQQLIGTGEEIEAQYYCFTYFSELEVAEGDTLMALLNRSEKGLGKGFQDTLRLSLHDPVRGYKHQLNQFHYKLPTQVQVLYQFKFKEGAKSKAPEELSPEEKWVAESYAHYLSDPRGVSYLVDSLLLDSLIKQSYLNNNLGTSVQYALTRQTDNSVVLTSSEADTAALLASVMHVPILANQPFNLPYRLSLHFPEGEKALLYSQWPVLVSSAAVLVILVVLLGLFVRTLWQEKQLAELKSDFVGNMSHEFKTPVSNINLALDTLALDGQKELSPESILNIIRQENNRLRDNLERVMNVSMVENRGLEIQPTTTDTHTVIESIVASHCIKLNGSGGDISFQAQALHPTISVDQIHFGNVVSNLIDNAIKYSNGPPEVLITTEDGSDGLVLKVKDNGIGLSKAECKRIFDKFYRVPTGKVHNVKGFGLGLAYVQRVVSEHRGRVEVSSEKDRGSEFTLTWPRT